MNERVPTPSDTRELRRALGQFPTGVSVVTCLAPDGTWVGMTANSFTSVSLDPPLVAWSIDRSAKSFEAFLAADRFAFSVLSQSQTDVSNRFAQAGRDKFADVPLAEGLGGVPLLAGASAHIECAREALHEAGDHVIQLGRVARFERFARPPLVFVSGRYGSVADAPEDGGSGVPSPPDASPPGSGPAAADAPRADGSRQPRAALTLREANEADVAAIVALLADDALGAEREVVSEPPDPAYRAAFERIAANPDDRIILAEASGIAVGCLQLTVLHGLSRHAARRGLIEGVRVASAWRGRGVGEAMVRHAIEASREAGCAMVQLTSDARRERARVFYERLGFEASHVGMKLMLTDR